MRILGIDYGDARVGIAVSDPLMLTAQGIKTLPNKVFDKMLESLDEIYNEYKPEKIVLGFPKNISHFQMSYQVVNSRELHLQERW